MDRLSPSPLRVVVVGLAVGLAAIAVWRFESRADPAPRAAPAPRGRVAGEAPDAIACLGRIMPEDGVVRLSARSLAGQPAIVAAVAVKEGDAVRKDQIVATLDSHDQLEASWHAAEAGVDVARTRLAQVRAGAKPADRDAQRAEIERLNAEQVTSARELQRWEQLFTSGAAAAAELDTYRLRAQAAVDLLSQAKARLASLEDVRDVDVAYGEAQLSAAARAEAEARAEFERSQIRSPMDGLVIAIHAWPGEQVSDAGIMEIGRTSRMFAVAEVDERDVPFLRLGQRASITTPALPSALSGVVTFVAPQVRKNDQRNVDPVAPTDARVVEAKILLDDPTSAARLINAQVTIRISR